MPTSIERLLGPRVPPGRKCFHSGAPAAKDFTPAGPPRASGVCIGRLWSRSSVLRCGTAAEKGPSMKLGLFINTQFPEGYNVADRVPEMIEQVRAARDAGFASL